MMTKTIQNQGKIKAKRRKKAKGAPKRPLSAYNVFFQKERRRLVLEAVEEESSKASPEQIAEWLKSGRDRPHRKSHGKIGFQKLVKMVSTKWKNLPEEDKKGYKLIAQGEQIRYKEELQVWKNLEEQRINKEKRAEHEKKCAAALASKEEDSLVAFAAHHPEVRNQILAPAIGSSTEVCGLSNPQASFSENSLTQDIFDNLNDLDESIELFAPSSQNQPAAHQMCDNLLKLKDMIEQAKSLSRNLVQHVADAGALGSNQQYSLQQRLNEASSIIEMTVGQEYPSNADVDSTFF
mmetsp:Transcript_16761/g.23300  ORF Transcript_16761/g.23300 Transcript_16761/m.23300 type:complete len:293 (-) Transcript_16761:381-1259(-)